jgi:hypothetical protein
MAEIPFLLGAIFETQTTRGTATTMPAIAGGAGTAGAFNIADGAVLGDPSAGAGESGISLSLGKTITEKAVQTGSFTRDFANYVARTVETFSIAVPLKGNGATATTPVAENFTPDLGIVALLRAAGLTGAESGATWQFTPVSSNLITAAVMFGNESSNGVQAIIKDIEAKTLTLDFTPGESAVATYDLGGILDSVNESGSWPAAPFEYGNQSTLSAPAVESVAFQWGPSTPAARSVGFSQLSVVIDLGAEDVPSSNATGGIVPRQTGRDITITGVIDAVSTDATYELDQLAESLIANADPISFQVGTVAGAADTCNAYKILCADPELISLEAADPLGNSQAWSIELKARSATANGEFEWTFN